MANTCSRRLQQPRHGPQALVQAIKEAGLKPGKDILVVSIDAVPDIFQAFIAGEANATVELTPNMAGPRFRCP